MSDLLDGMNSDDALLVSTKLLDLSFQCRPASMYHASRAWFLSLIIAVDAPIPADLAFNLLNGRDIYPYLDQDWKPRADEYLELLADEMWMKLEAVEDGYPQRQIQDAATTPFLFDSCTPNTCRK
jgi:hypothetical protein